MRAQQGMLQGGGILRGQANVGKASEAGRHAVDDGTRGDGSLDDGPGGFHAGSSAVAEANGRSPGDRGHVGDRQGAAELDHSLLAIRSAGWVTHVGHASAEYVRSA